MKQKFTLVIILILVLFIILVLYIRSFRVNPPTPSPTPSPVTSQDNFPSEVHGPIELELLKQKPWLNKLPIKNPEYYIEYNYQQNFLLVRLYTYPSFSIPKEVQIEHLQNQVFDLLLQLGIDRRQERIEWIIE